MFSGALYHSLVCICVKAGYSTCYTKGKFITSRYLHINSSVQYVLARFTGYTKKLSDIVDIPIGTTLICAFVVYLF